MKYRELRKKLNEYRIREEVQRGKGSHRYFVRTYEFGKTIHYTIPYHGENEDVHPRYIKAMERIFGITLV
ncbi:MAG: type II toxin-antitoxin system HicA family toxin [Firmicutes bacterium]|nr:type II toxin-antitoxin system HicA family toxin [Bacillota bacterium]